LCNGTAAFVDRCLGLSDIGLDGAGVIGVCEGEKVACIAKMSFNVASASLNEANGQCFLLDVVQKRVDWLTMLAATSKATHGYIPQGRDVMELITNQDLEKGGEGRRMDRMVVFGQQVDNMGYQGGVEGITVVCTIWRDVLKYGLEKKCADTDALVMEALLHDLHYPFDSRSISLDLLIGGVFHIHTSGIVWRVLIPQGN